MTFDELIIEYTEKFGENVPIYYLAGVQESKVVKIIEKAIADNKPITPEYIEGADY